jgi:hypothetical protein
VLFELGSIRVATGRHVAAPPPPVSADVLQSIVSAEVSKALPPNARAVRDLSVEAARLASGAPATAQPADPGPLPNPTETTRQPVRFDVPYGYNQTVTPGRGKQTSFGVLRQLARVSDLTRICIEVRKDQLTSIKWDVVPREKQGKNSAAVTARCAAAKAFFNKPDKRRSFSRWLRHAMEDVFVVDALSIYRQPTRGGQLYALRIIDGTTIVPLVDHQGEIPEAPNVAYRQIVRGQPIEGGDCSVDQLYYLPRTVTESPYGLSPTEAVLLTINAALNRQVFNLNYYSEGNVPRGLMSAPENWTAKQIADYQTIFDELIAGNLNVRSRIKLVGKGMAESLKLMADPDFKTEFDEWLMKIHCAAFAVTPAEIGFTDDVNKSSGDSQENLSYRRGVRPLSLFFKELFDDVLANGLDSPDLEWAWSGGEPEDKKLQAEVDKIYWSIGKVSTDELRVRDGQEPVGLGPCIETPLGPMPIDQMLETIADDDPNTNEVDPPDAADDEPAAREAEAQKDLRSWKSIAIKSLRAGQPPRDFTSTAIPAGVKIKIRVGLLKAKTPADVLALFEPLKGAALWPAESVTKAIQSREYRGFVGAPRVALTRFRHHFQKQYKAQGRALAGDLQRAIEGAGE